jgi:hypothetical protein
MDVQVWGNREQCDAHDEQLIARRARQPLAFRAEILCPDFGLVICSEKQEARVSALSLVIGRNVLRDTRSGDKGDCQCISDKDHSRAESENFIPRICSRVEKVRSCLARCAVLF